jgi:hypothetical protein
MRTRYVDVIQTINVHSSCKMPDFANFLETRAFHVNQPSHRFHARV